MTQQCQLVLKRACQASFRCRGVTVQLAAFMNRKVVQLGQASQSQVICWGCDRARIVPIAYWALFEDMT